MGFLIYGSAEIQFEDRLLAHLQIVVVNKLRRRESFSMSWRDQADAGEGRSAIWLDPAIPLYFKFEGSRVPAIDREWLNRLDESANSSTGLVVTDEQGEALPLGKPTAAVSVGVGAPSHSRAASRVGV